MHLFSRFIWSFWRHLFKTASSRKAHANKNISNHLSNPLALWFHIFFQNREKKLLVQACEAARSLKIPFTYIVFRNCDILLCAQHTVWWMRRENRKWHVFAFAVQAISAVLLSILFVSEGFLENIFYFLTFPVDFYTPIILFQFES